LNDTNSIDTNIKELISKVGTLFEIKQLKQLFLGFALLLKERKS